MKRFLALLFALSIVLTAGRVFIPEPQAHAESITVYVCSNTTKCYAKCSTSASSVTVGYGTRMTCTDLEGGWAKVKNSGKTAYCKATSLTTSNPNRYSVTGYAGKGASLYALPSSSAKKSSLDKGTKLTVLAVTKDSNWYRVKVSGKNGYMKAASVSAKEGTEETGGGGKADKLIKLAKEQLGKPYLFANKGPNKFDCSGFSAYCFKNVAKVTLKRSAKAQGYDARFEKIEKAADLKKADLVFFNTVTEDDDKCDHVGIYLGGGKFIHASSGAGKVVISSLSSGYYKKRFSWGRRVLK